MYAPTTSLTDPPADSPIGDGVLWVQSAAFGTTATVIAVTAIAAIGLLMLSGRLELRRGITVVMGCFILFGGAGLAAALAGVAAVDNPLHSPATLSHSPLSNGVRSAPPPAAFDPYAGASVPQSHQR